MSEKESTLVYAVCDDAIGGRIWRLFQTRQRANEVAQNGMSDLKNKKLLYVISVEVEA